MNARYTNGISNLSEHEHDEDDNDTNTENDSNSESEDEDTSNNNKSTNKVKRSLKLPPIDVWTENRAEIQREIQNIVPNNSCLYNRMNNTKFRIIPSDVQIHALM